MKRLLRRVASKLSGYGNLYVDLHIHNERDWTKFVNKYKPKIDIVGTDETCRDSFYTAELYIAGIHIKSYGPYFPNSNFNANKSNKVYFEQELSRSLLCAYKTGAVTVDEEKMKLGTCDYMTPKEMKEYFKIKNGE